MRVLKSPIIFLMALLMTSVAGAGAGPGSGGGGGSSIQFKGQECPFVLDLLSVDPSLAQKPLIAGRDCPIPAPASGAEIEKPNLNDLRIIEIARTRLQTQALRLASRNQRNAMILTLKMQDALMRGSFLRTSHRFNVIPRFDLSPELAALHPRIETAVLFLVSYGALISAPAWERLSEESKIGIIIHEALRQVQIGNFYYYVTDLTVQVLTAKILDGTLDDETLARLDAHLFIACLAHSRELPADLKTLLDDQGHISIDKALSVGLIGSFMTDINRELDKGQNRISDSLLQDQLPVLLRKLKETGILKH